MSSNVLHNKRHVDLTYKDAAQNQAASLVVRAGYLASIIGAIAIAVSVPAGFSGTAGIILLIAVGCVVGFTVLYPAKQLQTLTTKDKVARALKQLRVSLAVFIVLACVVSSLLVVAATAEFGAVGLLVQGVISLILLGITVTLSGLCIRACGAALANLQYYVPYDQALAANSRATTDVSGSVE